MWSTGGIQRSIDQQGGPYYRAHGTALASAAAAEPPVVLYTSLGAESGVGGLLQRAHVYVYTYGVSCVLRATVTYGSRYRVQAASANALCAPRSAHRTRRLCVAHHAMGGAWDAVPIPQGRFDAPWSGRARKSCGQTSPAEAARGGSAPLLRFRAHRPRVDSRRQGEAQLTAAHHSLNS